MQEVEIWQRVTRRRLRRNRDVRASVGAVPPPLWDDHVRCAPQSLEPQIDRVCPWGPIDGSGARFPINGVTPKLYLNEATGSAVDGIEQDFLGGGFTLLPLRHLEGVQDVPPMLRLVGNTGHMLRKRFGVQP